MPIESISFSVGSGTSDKLSITENQDKTEGISSKLPNLKWWGARHKVILLCFLCVFTSYSSRVGLSIAIVAMTGPETYNVTETDVVNLTDICPLPDDKLEQILEEDPISEFDWSMMMQGFVLGSFFCGYCVGNIFFGWAADRFSSRIVLGTTIGISSLLTVLTPLSAKASFYLFIAIRILQGAVQGALYPGVVSMLVSWATPQDRELFTSLVFAGCESGTLLALVLGGWLSETKFLGGWPSIFYLFGALGLLWMILWFILVRDKPEQDKTISQNELEYFQKQMANEKKNDTKMPVPYLEIAKSPQIWIAIFSSAGWHYGFYMLITELPTYLETVLHVDLMTNGLLSALPYLVMWVFSVSWGILMKFLNNRFISTTTVRKLSTAVAFCASGLSFAAMALVGCNATFNIIVLCLAVGLGGAMYCAFPCSCIDLAPNFSGTLMGILNTAGAIVGIIAPAVTGAIIDGNPSLSAWSTAFYITSIIMVLSGLVTCIFLKAERQTWNEPKTG